MARSDINLSSEGLPIEMKKLKGFSPFSEPSRYGIGAFVDFFKQKEVTYCHYDEKGMDDIQIKVKTPSFWDRIRGKKPEFISISGTTTGVNQCLTSLGIKKEKLTEKSLKTQRNHDIPPEIAKIYNFRISSMVSFVRKNQEEPQTTQFTPDPRVMKIQKARDKGQRSP